MQITDVKPKPSWTSGRNVNITHIGDILYGTKKGREGDEDEYKLKNENENKFNLLTKRKKNCLLYIII